MKKEKITYVSPIGTVRKNITINPEVWDKVGVILKESGYSRSRYIEIMFRSIIDFQTKPLMDVVQQHAETMFKVRKLSKEELKQSEEKKKE